jgi:hypothetical protein
MSFSVKPPFFVTLSVKPQVTACDVPDIGGPPSRRPAAGLAAGWPSDFIVRNRDHPTASQLCAS